MSEHPTPARSTRTADIALVAVAITWGGSYLAAQSMTHVASPVTVLALRFLPSLVVLLAVALVRRSRFTARVWGVGLLLGTFQATTLFLETSAVTRTSATNAGVLVCLAVVIAPALEGLVGGNRLPGRYFTAAATSVVGVAMLVGPSGFTSPNLGDVLVLFAACSRAGMMVASSHLTRGHAFDAVALNTVQTSLSALLYGSLAAPHLVPTLRHLDARHWLVLVFISLGCTCAAFLLQLWAIHHTSASRASLLMGTEPVWALVVGITLGGDHLGMLGLAGSLVIIAATFWGQRIERDWRRNGPVTELPVEDAG